MSGLSLKTQNIPALAALTALQLVAVALLNRMPFNTGQLAPLQDAGRAMLAIGVVAVWLSHLLPADGKNALVFFRLKNALPGHRFIRFAENDPRVDGQVLKARITDYQSILSDPKAQNSCWYREFYRPVADHEEVASAHKSYLLYRDAAAVSLFSGLIFLLGKLLSVQWMLGINLGSIWIFAAAAAGFLIAAGNAGRRLVTTAVAVSLAHEK